MISARRLGILGLSVLPLLSSACARAEDKGGPTWLHPQIQIYNPPASEVQPSTSPVFRSVDPQIIQKLIDLLEQTANETTQTVSPSPSLDEIKTFKTPAGLELKNRYTNVGVALSESLGWEPIKHVRVISEQNLKQRLTTIARWDHSPTVRTIALIALAKLKDENDLVYFKEALWSRNVGIRWAVVEALQQWDQPESLTLLRELVQKDDSPLIRTIAAVALARLGDSGAVQQLRQNMEDKDWFVRSLSAKALGDIGTVQDYDLLVNQLNREQTLNTNDFVLAEIAIAALKLYPLKLEQQRLERERKKNIASAQQPAPAPQAARDVLFELEPLVVTAPRLKIHQPVDPRINFQLQKMLQEKENLRIPEDAANQSPAYQDLNQLVTPNGIALKTRYTVLGYLLTEGLAGTKDFQLSDQLQRLAREAKDPDVRSYALVSLAYCRDRIHLGLFQDALRSESSADRFAAIQALQIWGYPEADSILVTTAKLDSAPVLRAYAAQALLSMGDPMGRDVLLTLLNDPDWVARAMAMRYLGEYGKPEDYDKLLAFLTSQQEPIVQAEMCSALLRLYARKFEQENK